MINDLGEKLKEISELMDENTIKSASNEDLMGYLVLVEKIKMDLEKVVNLEKNN